MSPVSECPGSSEGGSAVARLDEVACPVVLLNDFEMCRISLRWPIGIFCVLRSSISIRLRAWRLSKPLSSNSSITGLWILLSRQNFITVSPGDMAPTVKVPVWTFSAAMLFNIYAENNRIFASLLISTSKAPATCTQRWEFRTKITQFILAKCWTVMNAWWVRLSFVLPYLTNEFFLFVLRKNIPVR